MSLKNNVFLKIDWATHEAAKFACLNWHYSKSVPVGKLIKIGAWENNIFIGVVIFGRGANKDLGSPFGLRQDECCELVRIALTKHESYVSKILAVAIRFLRKLNPGLKMVVSFADKEQGHHGGIYQATNWIYAGETKPADEYLYNGKRWHGRAFRKSHGSHLPFISKGLKIVLGSSKHRYLMPLNEEIRSISEKLKKPYPKRAKWQDSENHSGLECSTHICALQNKE